MNKNMADDFDFDLPIDGERSLSMRKKLVRKKTTAHRSSTGMAAAMRRQGANMESLRPRISIEAATTSVKKANVYRRLALSFLAATILVVGAIIFFTMQRATITISQTAIPVAATITTDITNNASSTSGFVGIIQVITTSTERIFNPTTTVDKPGKAHGVITIKNEGANPQPLVATTRFLSADGILFRAITGVTVPAGGAVEVTVAADKVGPGSDIGPGKFTIPGLNVTAQKIVYGESAQSMVGGSDKVGKVTPADLDRAGEETRKSWMQQVQLALEQVKLSAGFTPLYTTIYVKSEVGAKPNEEVGQFSVKVSGAMALVAYPKAEVMAAVDNQVQSKAPTPYHQVIFDSAEPVVSIQSLGPNKTTAVLQAQRSGKAVLDVRTAAFQNTQFLGRTAEEIKQQLISIQGITEVKVSFLPFWLTAAPAVPSRIEVKINPAE